MPRTKDRGSFHRVEGLPVGTLVIERYVYTNPNGNDGVQWLLQIVDEDSDLALIQTCRTRREALGFLLERPE
jgi:hypothetical protein